jgi:hypothetical protein
MGLRLFRAKAVGDDLAAGRISAPDQSRYLVASFLIWLIPAYLFLFPAPRASEPQFFWPVWLIELALIVVFCIAGIAYCLRRCRVDPARNFMVDFSCLNAPVSLTTLLVAWGAFYLLTEGVLRLMGGMSFEDGSARLYDVLRMLVSAGAVLAVFLRIGNHMNRISQLRESGRSSA